MRAGLQIARMISRPAIKAAGTPTADHGYDMPSMDETRIVVQFGNTTLGDIWVKGHVQAVQARRAWDVLRARRP